MALHRVHNVLLDTEGHDIGTVVLFYAIALLADQIFFVLSDSSADISVFWLVFIKQIVTVASHDG